MVQRATGGKEHFSGFTTTYCMASWVFDTSPMMSLSSAGFWNQERELCIPLRELLLHLKRSILLKSVVKCMNNFQKQVLSTIKTARGTSLMLEWCTTYPHMVPKPARSLNDVFRPNEHCPVFQTRTWKYEYAVMNIMHITISEVERWAYFKAT